MNRFLTFLLLGCILLPPKPAYSQLKGKREEPARNLNLSVRVNFGVMGKKPLVWDGEASIDVGKITDIRGFQFGDDDEVFPDKNRWRCSIERLRGRDYAQNLSSDVSVREFVEEILAKGVEIDIQGTKESVLTISTAAGNFSLSLSDLVIGRKTDFLSGNLRMELMPSPHKIPQKGEIQNYSAIASDYNGNVWLAWVSFSKGKERLLISRFDGGLWDEPEVIDNGKDGYLRPAIACRPNGDLWIVWPGREKGNWDLFAREYKISKRRWSSIVRLTKNRGPDVHPAMASDPYGRIYLCWQGSMGDDAEIFLRICDEKGWGEPFSVTDNNSNDWEPDLAVNPQGRLLITWEGFRDGLHHILAREWIADRATSEIIIKSSKFYIGHATVAAGQNGWFWISWDEAGPDWGFGEEEEERTVSVYKFDELQTQIDYDKVAIIGRRGRYNSRNLGIVCLQEGEKLYLPAHNPLDKLPAPMKIYADNPRTAIDPQGRLWIIFQHYSGKIPFYIHNQLMEIWKFYAIYYDGIEWSDPIPMPHNTWRQLNHASVCIDKDGHLWTAYTHDSRETGKRDLKLPGISVSSLAISSGERASLPLSPYFRDIIESPNNGEKKAASKDERYCSELGKPSYTLYWGSFHDMHDVRGRMSMDGFVIDAFKYAMDDWAYDFLGLKDYACRSEGWFTNENYAWWETQKAIDLFIQKRSFLSFFLKAKSPFLRPEGHSIFKKSPPKGVPLIMGVYAKDFAEESLVKATEKRRQYVATDKIILDFWIAGHPMGDQFDSTDRYPKLEVKVVGTGKLKSVDILRNAECIYSTEPEGNEARFTFVDMGLNPNVFGEYHYLLQAIQENGRMAWTPPACLHYYPGYDD
ncbi:hypothetical protein JXL19_10215 [bacterium]|nr:hypothetical protein [bacterium]